MPNAGNVVVTITARDATKDRSSPCTQTMREWHGGRKNRLDVRRSEWNQSHEKAQYKANDELWPHVENTLLHRKRFYRKETYETT